MGEDTKLIPPDVPKGKDAELEQACAKVEAMIDHEFNSHTGWTTREYTELKAMLAHRFATEVFRLATKARRAFDMRAERKEAESKPAEPAKEEKPRSLIRVHSKSMQPQATILKEPPVDLPKRMLRVYLEYKNHPKNGESCKIGKDASGYFLIVEGGHEKMVLHKEDIPPR
jgi:hypothetical protein